MISTRNARMLNRKSKKLVTRRGEVMSGKREDLSVGMIENIKPSLSFQI